MNETSKAEAPSESALFIERAPVPIVEVQGTAHKVSYVNPAFCRLTGKASRELVGRAFAEIVPGGAKCLTILDDVYRTGEALTHALEDDSEVTPACWLYAMWPRLDAEARPNAVIIQMTRAANFRLNVTAVNEALLLAGLTQHELREKAERLNGRLAGEIAERKQAEAALQGAKERLARQAEELERTVAERTEKLRETVGDLESFSYSIAHDLRAPLRSIQGYSTRLLEEHGNGLDETGKTYLQRMGRSAIRLDKLIQDVLSYTQVLGTTPRMERVDMDRLVRDLVALDAGCQPPKAVIEIEGKLPEVLGHEPLLAQCVSNLLGNAVKFVAPGTQPQVKIWAEPAEERVRVWFKDNGLGIAKENQTRIFRMFERIFPTEEFEGTGIGLTIVRKAVERMRGRLGVESELGQGSRFWIELQKAA